MKKLALLIAAILALSAAPAMAQNALSSGVNNPLVNASKTGVGFTNNGGTSQTGSLVINGIGAANGGQALAPVLTGPNQSTPGGGASATFYCVALDINGLTNLTGGVGNTMPSSSLTMNGGTSGQPATIVCPGMTGAMGFIVLKNGTSNSELGSCLNLTSGNSCSVPDTGQALTSYTANGQDMTALIGQAGAPIMNFLGQGIANYFANWIDVNGLGLIGGFILNQGGNNFLISNNGSAGDWSIWFRDDPIRLHEDTLANLTSKWNCDANQLGARLTETDNDAACSYGATPAHSSCVVGTSCHSCTIECSESGSTFAWVIK